MTLVPGHFDNPPAKAITAEQVRDLKVKLRARSHTMQPEDDADIYLEVLRGLSSHPGVSSTARAVIEEALR